MARATLRRLLGEALHQDPATLCFEYGAQGKPALAGPAAASGLCFNASHSGEYVLIGLAQGAPLGVDIECHRPLVDPDALARRHFPPAEAAAYAATPEPGRQQAFFEAWTRKEAAVKARGGNLLRPESPDDMSGWCAASFSPVPGCSASIVVQGASCHLDP
jgi:4'-phosphopantetheinyl transferase